MIIGIIGHGASGASALVDIIKEFDEIKISEYEREFPIAYAPDGLLDLEHHLVTQPVRYYSSDIAIYRFLEYVKKEQKYNIHYSKNCKGQFLKISEQFINDITQVEWKGFWYYDYYFHSMVYDKIRYSFGRRFDKYIGKKIGLRISCNRKMHLSIKPDNFYTAAKVYVKNILESMNLLSDEKILLDQPFPYNDPESCFKFFDDPVALVVNRDPRDVYAYFKNYIAELESWIPCDNVRNFIDYYRQIRKKSYEDSDRVVTFQYEDLVFHYDEVRQKIIKYLKINDTCDNNKNKFFKPEVSVGNVQIFKRFPDLAEDIKLIENELAEYLYTYPADMGGLDTSKGKIIVYTDSQKKK